MITRVHNRVIEGSVLNVVDYGAVGDGVVDDTDELQSLINTWTQGVVTANPSGVLPYGAYKITDTLEVENSASQWTLVGEAKARSSSIQATTALDGLPMLSGRNLRDFNIERIEFLGNSGGQPSHGLYFDKDSGSQIGSGGPGKGRFKELLFRNVDIGFECVKIAGSNNDEFLFEDCTFGQGITKWGVKFTDTNSAWNNLYGCRFDTVGYADVTTVVAQGADRGGNFAAQNCKHVSGSLCYLIGSCRSFSIQDVFCEQQDNLLWSSGPILEAATLSVTTSNTFNGSGANLPIVAAGDLLWTKGFTNAANNGIWMATGVPTTSAIQVTTIAGAAPSLTNESAGATAIIATTKLLNATDTTNGRFHGADASSTDPYPIIWDGDSANHVLHLSGDISLVGGAIVCMGNATVVLGPGRYQVSELIVQNGRIILEAGAYITAGTVTKTFLGTGRIINHGANGGQIDDQVTWNPGDLADGAQESTTVTVTGARVGDHVQVFPGVDLQELTYSAAISANDTVEITLFNFTGGNINLGSSVWHVRVFPPS